MIILKTIRNLQRVTIVMKITSRMGRGGYRGGINTMIMYKIKNQKNKQEFDLKRTEVYFNIRKLILKVICDSYNNAKKDENVNGNGLNLESLLYNSC